MDAEICKRSTSSDRRIRRSQLESSVVEREGHRMRIENFLTKVYFICILIVRREWNESQLI